MSEEESETAQTSLKGKRVPEIRGDCRRLRQECVYRSRNILLSDSVVKDGGSITPGRCIVSKLLPGSPKVFHVKRRKRVIKLPGGIHGNESGQAADWYRAVGYDHIAGGRQVAESIRHEDIILSGSSS